MEILHWGAKRGSELIAQQSRGGGTMASILWLNRMEILHWGAKRGSELIAQQPRGGGTMATILWLNRMEDIYQALGNKSGSFCEAVNCE